tara:strand:+ start:3754 stop:5598 length:1845 start_codon:yes stop_codon:yes gene_type:complete
VTGEVRDFVWPICEEEFKEFTDGVDKWIIHNGSGFDGPMIQEMFPSCHSSFTNDKIIDTLVISRTVNYAGMRTHSLKEWGIKLGLHKGDWDDWSCYSMGMHDYCKQDIAVLKGIWKKLGKYAMGALGKKWQLPFTIEKDSNTIGREINTNGFAFDSTTATGILTEIQEEMLVLEAEFQKEWPPELVEVKRIKYRKKKDGTLYSNVDNALVSYPSTYIDTLSDELVCLEYESFAPSSPKKRIDKLWEAGWNPYVKTKTHAKMIRDARFNPPDPERKAKFEKYGWMCNEDNLTTLPKSAPKSAKKLAMWLTLEGRRSSLEEWLGNVQHDGRIHGSIFHIGAWTHRCSHSSPNTANISSPWPTERKPETGVEEIKSRYDSRLRACWKADDAAYLVGTDADGIQLRVLAHYMNSEKYIDSIVKGDKKYGTDIHSLNMRSLGPICKSRGDSKTFIYAWLLGAGIPKVASILGCSAAQGKNAVQNFLDSLPELKHLKRIRIPRDAARGYFIGLDGRRVNQTQEYLILAGYLQNGEAILMKRANAIWRENAKEIGISYKQVGFIQDEWQCEVYGTRSEAELLGKLQCDALVQAGKEFNMNIPITGSTDITKKRGGSWLETH